MRHTQLLWCVLGLSVSVTAGLLISFGFNIFGLPSSLQSRVVSASSQQGPVGNVPEGLNAADWAQIQAQITADRYAFGPGKQADSIQASNPSTRLQLQINDQGAVLRPSQNEWQLGLRTQAIGRSGQLDQVVYTAPIAEGTRADIAYISHPRVSEWYVNRSNGIEHGWTLSSKPAGHGDVEIVVSVDGFKVAQADENLLFWNAEQRLQYNKLQVFDALDKPLSARMQATQSGLLIAFNDANAQYPVTVDPLIQTAELFPDSEGPNTELNFGRSVALSADGATLLVGQASTNEDTGGLAYVFTKDAAGAWSRQHRFSNPVRIGGNQFGLAVALGGLNGDTALIGGPGRRYELNNGSAHVYKRFTSANGVPYWSYRQELTAPENAIVGRFGSAVALDGAGGDIALIGAPEGGGDLLGRVYVFTQDAGGDWSHQQTLAANDGAYDDRFGTAVAMLGNRSALIGAPYDDDNGNRSGSAYYFVRDTATNVWSQWYKLLPDDGEEGDLFGQSVALRINALVMGAPGDDDNGIASGSAYIFNSLGGGNFTQDKLTASDPATFDGFGVSVAIIGDTVVVGASGDDDYGNNIGSAYVFTGSTGDWTQQQKLGPGASAVSLAGPDGDLAIIGEPNSGTVSVLSRTAGLWTEQQQLGANIGAEFDDFGYAVAVGGASGDTALIGAPSDNDDGRDSGSVYVFTRNSAGAWTKHQKLTANDSAANQEFGFATALGTNTALIGASPNSATNSVYVFTRDGAGNWSQQQKLEKSLGNRFGWALALGGANDDTALIAASTDDGNDRSSGSVLVFTRDGVGNWSEQQKLVASDGAQNDRFGAAVALGGIDGSTALIGASGDDDNGSTSGSAYVYTRDGAGNWSMQQKLLASDGSQNAAFGSALALGGLDGNTALIGAPDDSDSAVASGSAYIFTRDGAGNWLEQRKFIAIDGEDYDNFGKAVALAMGGGRGDFALIGAPFDFGRGYQSGSVYVFARDDAGEWSQQQKFARGRSDANFGHAIAAAGSTVVAGAPGTDTVFGDDSGMAFILEPPPADFGDAPEAGTNFPTTQERNGARHVVSSLFMGLHIDEEPDGLPERVANGDDLNGDPNDEDGATFSGLVIGSEVAKLNVVTSQANNGLVNAWIDFDQSGSWEPSEQVISDGVIIGGSHDFAFSVPSNALRGKTFARVRMSTLGGDGITGEALDGEVIDQEVSLSLPFLVIDDVSTTEGNFGQKTLTFTVTLSQAVSHDVSFGGRRDGETATAGTDFTGPMSRATIPAGSTEYSIDFSIIGDLIIEPDETFVVAISGPTGATISDLEGVGTIINDDFPPTVSLAVSPTTFAEDGGTATVTATLSNPSAQDVTVSLAYSGIALRGSDYSAASQIVIPSSDMSASIEITGLADGIDEINESVVVDIVAVDNGAEDISGGEQQGTTSIIDGDPEPSVTLGISGSSFSESGGVASLTATLSAVSSRDVSVSLGYSGSASFGSDYLGSALIVVPAGSNSASRSITGIHDTIDEPDETVVVNITGVTNGSESGVQQQTASILDDDDAPTVTLSTDVISIAENNAGVASVTATLSEQSGQAVTVELGFSGSAVGAGVDYSASASQIVIAPGDIEGSITLTGEPDSIFEDDETIIIDLDDVTNGTEAIAQQTTVSITDDDTEPTVILTVDQASIGEAGGVATFTATLSNATTKEVTVDLGFSGEATGAGNDYTASAMSISIAPEKLIGEITVTATNDTTDEPNESVIVDIADVTNASEFAVQQQSTAIADNDDPPVVTLSVDNPAIGEAGVASIIATLSNPSAQDVTVFLGFSGSAVGGGVDYSASANQIVVPANSLTASMVLTAIQDVLIEGDETIITDITAVTNGTQNGVETVTVTIMDDEAAPTVSISDASQLEGNVGNTKQRFIVSLSVASTRTVTVQLDSADGSATAGSDYSAVLAQLVSFAPGETRQAVEVTLFGDLTFEPDESYALNLSNARMAVIADRQGVGIIKNDEPVPGLAVNDVTQDEGNSGTTVFSFTVTLTPASSETVTVQVDSADDGAFAGDDYTPVVAQTLIFEPGVTTQPVDVTVAGDTVFESSENFRLILSNAANADIGNNQGIGSIGNDDSAPEVSLSLIGTPFAEAGGVATLTAGLSNQSSSDVMVNLEFAGSASRSDFSIRDTKITIPAGSDSGLLLLSGIDDADLEGDETIIINIVTVANGVAGTANSVTAIISDDELAPTPSLGPTALPTPTPASSAGPAVTPTPSAGATASPTPAPSLGPTAAPTPTPASSAGATASPTPAPSLGPTAAPTATPAASSEPVQTDQTLLAFTLSNVGDEIGIISQISALLVNNDSNLSILQLKLLLDVNTNAVADSGDIRLGQISEIPDGNRLVFDLVQVQRLGPSESLRLIVVAEFK